MTLFHTTLLFFSISHSNFVTTINKKGSVLKNSVGGGKTAPAAFLLRRGQFDPSRETSRTPTLSGLGPGGTVPPVRTTAPQRRTSPQAAPFNWVGVHGPSVGPASPRTSGAQRGGFFDPQAETFVPDGARTLHLGGAAGSF